MSGRTISWICAKIAADSDAALAELIEGSEHTVFAPALLAF
jgi:hypothetical protein